MKKIILILSIMTNFSFSQSKNASLVIINAKIWTVDKSLPVAEAIAIKDDKILSIGNNSLIQKYINKDTKVINAGGRLVLPGFIDNHTHFIYGGSQLLGINLRDAKTKTEFAKRIKDYAEKYPGKWITGGDWDHELWDGADLPDKSLIDKYTPNTPVFVCRFDGHMALANSYALSLAGITKDSKNPQGGTILKNPITSEPTGIIKDEAMAIINVKIPNSSREEKIQYAEEAFKHASLCGITSIQDVASLEDIEIYSDIEKRNKLTARMYCRIPLEQNGILTKKDIKIDKESSSLIKMGVLKAFADGSVGSSTALFFEPYAQDTTTRGLAMEMLQNGDLEKYSMESDKNGYQLSIHAIGDSANSEVLDIFERITKNNQQWDRRFRIEHAQHIHPKDFIRFKNLNVIASAQPYHCIDDGCWVIKRIGKKRCETTYPFRSFLDNGIRLTFGSDWTVAPMNVLQGIYAAVTRRTLDGKNPDGWFPEQKISVQEAIECYTINNAYASFEENIKGSLSAGKLADIVILEDDILSIDPIKIFDVKVYMTIMGGNIIYTKNKEK